VTGRPGDLCRWQRLLYGSANREGRNVTMKIAPALAEILSPAYGPCAEFSRNCGEMRWNPKEGHVPRGFLGACGDQSEVELILVVAEPGDPHHGESHSGLDSAYSYATAAFRTGKDQFHRNIRAILDMCWPNLSFEQQLRKFWLTESVLCSARSEGGSVSRTASKACGQRYLLAQLALFPQSLVVALGSKAQDRLRSIGANGFIPVWAAAPPGCNRPEARESWKIIPAELERRRRRSL
jgi:hypothetical protein